MHHILLELFITTIFILSNRTSHSYLSQRGLQFRWAWSHWGVQTSRSTGVTRNTGKQYSALINGLSLMATACMKIFCNWRQKRKLKFGSEFKEWSILLSNSHPSVKSGNVLLTESRADHVTGDTYLSETEACLERRLSLAFFDDLFFDLRLEGSGAVVSICTKTLTEKPLTSNK